MFQKKDIEAYRQMKAPAELKNRISQSVKQTQKKQKTALVAAAAGIALMVSVGGWMYPENAVLSVNDMAVNYRAVEIESTSRGISVASAGSKQGHRITVPLEIDVTEKAHITVSTGTMQQTAGQDVKTVSELDIFEKTVIYWILDGNMDETPVCTITVGEKTYQYSISMDETTSRYAIRKIK